VVIAGFTAPMPVFVLIFDFITTVNIFNKFFSENCQSWATIFVGLMQKQWNFKVFHAIIFSKAQGGSFFLQPYLMPGTDC
jgi:hypothetical protein